MAKKQGEMSLSLWFFIVASIVIGSALLVVALKWFSGLQDLNAKTQAQDEFDKIANSISSLCNNNIGSKDTIILTINDFVTAVYASDFNDEQGYPQSEACREDINKNECTSLGENLCIKIRGEELTCKKLNCPASMNNFGSQEKGFISILKKIRKQTSYDIELTIERTIPGIQISSHSLED